MIVGGLSGTVKMGLHTIVGWLTAGKQRASGPTNMIRDKVSPSGESYIRMLLTPITESCGESGNSDSVEQTDAQP